MFNSARIAELQEQLTAAQEQVGTLTAANAALTTANAAAIAERDGFQGQIAGLTQERDTARTELATATANHAAEIARINGEVEQRVQREVIDRCAAAGVEPIAQAPGTGKSADTKPEPGAGLTGMEKARAILAAKHAKGYAKD